MAVRHHLEIDTVSYFFGGIFLIILPRTKGPNKTVKLIDLKGFALTAVTRRNLKLESEELENACKRIIIGFGFTSDQTRKR